MNEEDEGWRDTVVLVLLALSIGLWVAMVAFEQAEAISQNIAMMDSQAGLTDHEGR